MAKYQTWHVWIEIQNEGDLSNATFWALYPVESRDKYEAAARAAELVADVAGWIPLRAHTYDMGFTSTKPDPLKIVPKRIFEVERPIVTTSGPIMKSGTEGNTW